MSVLRQLFRGVRLQEACFRDVVILYRAAVPDAGVSVWGREHVLRGWEVLYRAAVPDAGVSVWWREHVLVGGWEEGGERQQESVRSDSWSCPAGVCRKDPAPGPSPRPLC